MKTLAFSCTTLFCLALLAGCSPNEPKATTGTDFHAQLPRPEISVAEIGGAGRDEVTITGVFFKLQSDYKSDVIASLDGRTWLPASKIMESSGKKYRVVLPYSGSYPSVWIRIYGMNEQYSDPYLLSRFH